MGLQFWTRLSDWTELKWLVWKYKIKFLTIFISSFLYMCITVVPRQIWCAKRRLVSRHNIHSWGNYASAGIKWKEAWFRLSHCSEYRNKTSGLAAGAACCVLATACRITRWLRPLLLPGLSVDFNQVNTKATLLKPVHFLKTTESQLSGRSAY